MCNEAIKEVMTEYMVDAFSRVKRRHFKAWVMNVIKKTIMAWRLTFLLYLFHQAGISPDHKTRRPALPYIAHVIISLIYYISTNLW